jgi:putative DNA primase/helicase
MSTFRAFDLDDDDDAEQPQRDRASPLNGGELSPTAEESIALAFAERHAYDLRYVAAWNRWLAYDGARWQHDDTLHTFDRVRALCRETAIESEKKASTVASAKTVAAVERLAKADRRLAAITAQWDAAGWLINTGGDDNGSCDV